MDCREELRWYERRWEEDRARWEAERSRLERALEEQEAAYLELKRRMAEETACLQRERQALEEENRRLKEENLRLQKALSTLSHPPLGEGFFRRLREALSLLDDGLLAEAETLRGRDLLPWLQGVWGERGEALAQALRGEEADWSRVWTGLLLEWACLAWLEGVRDA